MRHILQQHAQIHLIIARFFVYYLHLVFVISSSLVMFPSLAEKIYIFSKFLLILPRRCDIISLAVKKLLNFISGCGAVGSALDWGSRGREFKSRHSDQQKGQSFCSVLFVLVQSRLEQTGLHSKVQISTVRGTVEKVACVSGAKRPSKSRHSDQKAGILRNICFFCFSYSSQDFLTFWCKSQSQETYFSCQSSLYKIETVQL